MDEQIVRFSRLKVRDFAAFSQVHERALAVQSKLGIEEQVFQSRDDERDLTVMISGAASAVEQWMSSPERAALAGELELESAPESWTTKRV